jgi:histone-lysine N-methyltransferase SETD3
MAAAAAAKAATGKLGAGCEKVPVHLPPITEEDPLHQDKKVRRERKKKLGSFGSIHLNRMSKCSRL